MSQFNHAGYVVDTGESEIQRDRRSKPIALLARRRSDLLHLGLASSRSDVFPDPLALEGRAAWYSLGFVLRKAAGLLLDIEPNELKVGLHVGQDAEGRICGHSFLYDVLDNGAGYSSHLARPEVFGELLKEAHKLGEEWQGENHAHCDTSCDACLRDYTNMAYHGLLDWRLALDMLALLENSDTPLTLEGRWTSPRLTRSLEVSLGQLHFIPLEGLAFPGFQRTPRSSNRRKSTLEQRIVIVRHPLWQDAHPLWGAQMQAVQAVTGVSPEAIQARSPFLLIRRPSDSLR